MNIKETWDTYALSWKVKTLLEKQAMFEKCLDLNCNYTSPIINTKGWDALSAHMLDFHKKIPGGYFSTTYFLEHNSRSIARWNLLNDNDVILGDGISYCEYNSIGRLKVMTGFFEID